MRSLRFALAAIVATASAGASRSAASIAADCRAHAPEAAMRSGLAIDVVLRVMRAESGGRPTAVSVKGAMGCMQIMPTTWTDLSRRYGLGSDPYDARMNMVGGALYLAELARRFGWPGAYAAYNAGPSRYMRYAANGVPLPAETVAYAARLGGAAAPAIAAVRRARWQEARLFLGRGRAAETSSVNEARELAASRTVVPILPVPNAAPSTARPAPTLFPLASKSTLAVE